MIGRLLYASLFIAALVVYPVAAAPVTAVTWHRDGVLTWERLERHVVAPATVHRLTVGIAPGHSKVIAHGSPGIAEVRTLYVQRDGGRVHRKVIASTLVLAAKPRIVAEGIGATPLYSFETHGLMHMAYMARSAIEMMATAYTAGSAGGSGMTAIGRRAGYGIVAVDPRVIPLGTHLYIPGYGVAIAGDTGGAIVGNRIDLGFDSLRDAMLFGRRGVKVYRLR
ncbi:MAG TPA: 3D domain-containing protein [Candidatus Cybelea sp.]|nr:3D domain-containing protein [Candidatus Cybelea sp.]